MNIIDIQDRLKDFSEDQLVREMQMPSGTAPQFLVLSEINRRKRVRDDYSKQKAANEMSVAEEAIAAGGVPQSGIAGMSEAMAPQSSIAQGGVGTAMNQAMRPSPMPQRAMSEEEAMGMRSGGLMAYGRELADRMGQEKIDPFLNEVESMASERFGVGSQPQPMVSQQPYIAQRPGFMGRPPFAERSMYQVAQPIRDPRFQYNTLRGNIGALPPPQGKGGIAQIMPAQFFQGGGVVKAQNGLPLGLRINNPGNIRPGAGFIGETGEQSGYAQFESPQTGLRALARLLNTYGTQYGINTPRELLSRYAPKSDNPESFENYLKYFEQETGIAPDQEFDLVGQRETVMPAIVGFEQGQQPYSEQDYSMAIEAASMEDPTDIQDLFGVNKRQVSTVSPTTTDADEAVEIPPLWQDNWATKESDYNQYVKDAQMAGQEIVNPWEYEELQRRRAGREDDFLDVIDEDLVGTEFEKYIGNQDMIGNTAAGSARAAAEGTSPFDIADPRTGERGVGAASVAEEIAGNLGITSQEDAEIVGKSVVEAMDDLPPDASTEQIQEKTEAIIAGEGGLKSEGAIQKAQEQENSATSALADALEYTTSEEYGGIAAEIKDLQDMLKKEKDSDKWLALAQAGMQLMSSKEPTLMGALGEAGLTGLGAMREAQSRYQEGVIDLINARAKLSKGISESDAAATLQKTLEALGEVDDLGEFKIQGGARTQLEALARRLSGQIGSGSSVDVASLLAAMNQSNATSSNAS